MPTHHRHQVRTSHSSPYSLPPLFSVGVMYIPPRSVVCLVDAINSVSSRLLSCSSNSHDRFSTRRTPGRTWRSILARLCRSMRCDTARAVGVSRLRATRAPGKHVPLRFDFPRGQPARLLNAVAPHAVPCLRPSPHGRTPALHRAVHTPHRRPCRYVQTLSLHALHAGTDAHECCCIRCHRCRDAVCGCGSTGATNTLHVQAALASDPLLPLPHCCLHLLCSRTTDVLPTLVDHGKLAPPD